MDGRYYYRVDPDGDVMLVLGNQPGDESAASEDDASEDDTSEDDTSEDDTSEDDTSEEDAGDDVEPAEALEASVSQALQPIPQALLTRPNVLAMFGQGTICMQLSSKHLALASVYFRKMFNGPWKERHQL